MRAQFAVRCVAAAANTPVQAARVLFFSARVIAAPALLKSNHMKTTAFLTAALLTTALALHAADDKKKPAAKPAAEKPAAKEEAKPEEDGAKLTKEQSALQSALENHGRLKGFHVEGVLKTAEGNATLTGALGEGALSLDCTDVMGVKKKRLVTGGVFYLSSDGGKTWKSGDDAEKETTLLFNNIITAPLALAEKIVPGDWTAKEEKLGGEDVLHLTKPAKGKEAGMDVWLCREPEMNNMVFLRKVTLVVSGDDLELTASITYSKLTESVKITAPVEK